MLTDIGIWVSALMYVAIWSFSLPGENRLYRLAEYTMVGVACGYSLAQGTRVILSMGVEPIAKGQYYLIVELIIGLLIFTQVSNKYRFISRWPMALLIGSGIGVGIRTTPEVNILNQITANFLPILGVDPYIGISNLILIISCLSVLAYFYMTYEFKGPANNITKLGRYFIMILLGANWGSQLLIRATIFIGNVTWFLREFLFKIFV